MSSLKAREKEALRKGDSASIGWQARPGSKRTLASRALKCIHFFGFAFGFNAGSCEIERLKVQFTAHQTISMTDSLTVGLAPRSSLIETLAPVSWEMILLLSICCLSDLDTAIGFCFSPEVLNHQQIVEYWIPQFWLIFRQIQLQTLNFPTSLIFFITLIYKIGKLPLIVLL